MKDTAASGLLFDDDLSTGTLVDKEILSLVGKGQLIAKNFDATSLESSSYDVRVGFKGIIGGDGTVRELSESHMLEIQPGQYAGVVSYEKLNLPKHVFGRIGSKRALSYEGLILLTGNIVDAGYQGHLLFGIYNASQKKAILYPKKKICNIVFEKLSTVPEKQAPMDPFLSQGNFPDAFIEKMVNSEALGWMQISEKIKEIETLKTELYDIRKQYNDVMNPLKQLTETVKTISETVQNLSNQTTHINEDITELNSIVKNNNTQIGQLTTSLQLMSSEVGHFKSTTSNLETRDKEIVDKLSDLKSDVGKQKIFWAVIWGILILALGYFIRMFLK
jgi:deoxycytidine triphosphate deaminase